MKKGKKAVSPVVSTILLIMIVIVLAIIILLWANSFVREAINKTINEKTQTLEQWCKEVELSPQISEDGGSFGFINSGNVPLYQYEVKLSSSTSGGSEIVLIASSEGGSVNPGFTSIINNENHADLGNYNSYKSVKIIPILLGSSTKNPGSRREFKCSDKYAITI
ncbi:hypothetical protein J4218_06375 [Candidatus Pacearchaeota archaeon]|nr:hypothetical protein [Candidatus Pacearchaeota archaeon]